MRNEVMVSVPSDQSTWSTLNNCITKNSRDLTNLMQSYNSETTKYNHEDIIPMTNQCEALMQAIDKIHSDLMQMMKEVMEIDKLIGMEQEYFDHNEAFDAREGRD